MKKFWWLIAFIAIVVSLIWIYPVQEHFAEKTYERYIAEQGIDSSDIKEKIIIKDYTQGGFIIKVTYHSDPEFTYDYKYIFEQNGKYHRMLCLVYDMENVEVGCTGKKVKYPPMQGWWG